MTGPRTRFASPEAERLFGMLSDAARGFENTAVLEAGAVLVAQAISTGCFDVAGARHVVGQLAAAMIRDIEVNWTLTMAQRKKRQS
jgi:hypothetical protein